MKFQFKKFYTIGSDKSFTLIELLVAIVVFLIILGATFNLFLFHFKNQRKILAHQFFLDQLSYSLEYIGRNLRMAKKELNCLNPKDFSTCSKENPPYCLENYGQNYLILNGGKGVRFINPMKDYACVEFLLEEGLLKEKIIKPEIKEGALLSKKIKIKKIFFKGFGLSPEDEFQPKITILIIAEIPQEKLKAEVQTTISQRDLDLIF